MKKILLLILFLVCTPNVSATEETGDWRAVPVSSYGQQADGTLTKIKVDSDGKVYTSGGSGAWTATAYGAYLSGDASMTGDLTVDSTTFVVDSSNDRVGIGTVAPADTLDIVGSADISENLSVDTINVRQLEGSSGNLPAEIGNLNITTELSVSNVCLCEDVWDFNILSVSDVNVNTDPVFIGANTKGVTVTITEIKMWAVGYDDTACTILEKDGDGLSNSTTVDVINCTTGSNPYTDTEITITHATIENGHTIWIQLDNTDDPEQLGGYIKYEW